MVYTLAPYAMKAGMAAVNYGGVAKKAYAGAKLARAAYSGYKGVSAYKKASSKAKTKAKKKSDFRSPKQVDGMLHGISKDKVVSTRKAHEIKSLKDSPHYIRRYVGDTPMISTTGAQNWTNLVQLWKSSELQTLAAKTTAAQNRTYILGGSIKVVMTNFTNIAVNVRIHDWRAKIDVYTGEPDDCINKSLGAKYNETVAGTQYKVPWMSAKEAIQFNHQYKIIGQKDIILNPNETHIHDFYFKIDKFFEGNVFLTGSDPSYVKDFTHGILIRTLGTMDKENAANNFSYGTTKVGVIYHAKLDWKTPIGIPNSGDSATQSVYARQTNMNKVLASERYMEPETGAPVGTTSG